jgi:hypothetical protein
MPRSGEYAHLVRRLFRSHSALAVIGIGQKSRSAEALQGIASELGACGNRVVVVTSEGLLRNEDPSMRSRYRSESAPNVWYWPDGPGSSAGFDAETLEKSNEVDRLGYLCREFDVVLLDCAAADCSPSTAEVAALADAAVLVVEAGQTPKRRIQDFQRILETRGVRLAGCILMERRNR